MCQSFSGAIKAGWRHFSFVLYWRGFCGKFSFFKSSAKHLYKMGNPFWPVVAFSHRLSLSLTQFRFISSAFAVVAQTTQTERETRYANVANNNNNNKGIERCSLPFCFMTDGWGRSKRPGPWLPRHLTSSHIPVVVDVNFFLVVQEGFLLVQAVSIDDVTLLFCFSVHFRMD